MSRLYKSTQAVRFYLVTEEELGLQDEYHYLIYSATDLGFLDTSTMIERLL